MLLLRQRTFAFAALWAVVFPAWADDINTELPIKAVTVHPQSAIVTRQGSVSLPAGEHRLIVDGLPEHVDTSRLQLAIPNSAVRMGSLDVTRQHRGELISEREQALEADIQQLQDQRQVIIDRISSAETQLNFLSSMATGGDSRVQANVSGSELAQLIDTMGQSASQAHAAIREAKIEQRDINKEIKQLEYELKQIATQAVATSRLTVNLSISANLETPVAITYPVQEANWRWLYEARLDTDARQLQLLRQAVVNQGTGQDWDNVTLTLTTADQHRGTTTPELPPLLVDIFDPNASSREDDRMRAARAPKAESEISEAVVTASFIQTEPAKVIASQYLVEYEIPGATSVPANRQDKILPVDQQEFTVDLAVRSVPSVAPQAFLEARFTYEEDVPLQEGNIQLYRDGAFIGDTYHNAFLPGEPVRLAFGVDERVRVEQQADEEESREGGLLSRTNTDDVRTRFVITNYHNQPITVEVLDRVPVPQNTDIEVKISDEATPVSERDLDGKKGLLLWELQAPPGETQTIKHYYHITYPKDAALDFR